LLTLFELAATAEMSIAMLSRMENGQSLGEQENPNISRPPRRRQRGR